MSPLSRISRILCITAWLPFAAVAWGSASVRILDTWPAGDVIELAPSQTLYLRLAYDSSEPVRIWARPYDRGEPVAAGTNPSFTHQGVGEMLAWFFLMDGRRVDEIRIEVGHGDSPRREVAAVWRGLVIAGDGAASNAPEPDWVARLRAQEKALQRQAYEARMREPVTASEHALVSGFVLATLLLGVAGIVAPFRAVRSWQGGWRLAAGVPALLMALVVLNILVGVAVDPTSHNLWPFELLQAGLVSLAMTTVLFLLRKVRGA